MARIRDGWLDLDRFQEPVGVCSAWLMARGRLGPTGFVPSLATSPIGLAEPPARQPGAAPDGAEERSVS